MQDYIVTFSTKSYGTMSFILMGEVSKAAAIAVATDIARMEYGKGAKLKEARLYKGRGDHYVCKGG